MMKKDQSVLFVDIKENPEPIVIQSLCVQCENNGKTTLLMTKIPFFRQIIISSFFCEECEFKNNEVQFGGSLPDYGIQIDFRLMESSDLNRQLIKSEHAVIKIEELGLEIPEGKKAEITTIEGLLMRVEKELEEGQEIRKKQDKENYEKLQTFIQKIKDYRSGKHFPFGIKIIDESGNSNIKNPYAPKKDKNLEVCNIKRSIEWLTKMGYSLENTKQQAKSGGNKINFTKPFEENNFMHYEPTVFEIDCHACMMPGQMKMCQTSIPYFSDLTIMSFKCEFCGAHSTETKNSGQIGENGLTITLKASDQKDLKRQLFKSQTCAVKIPEIQLQLDYGTLGGVYTTVEGLLDKIHTHLKDSNLFGDSDSYFYERMCMLFEDLVDMREGRKKFTLVLRDPLSHSFLQNPYHPSEDKKASREQQARTQQENDMLGITDMKVENY